MDWLSRLESPIRLAVDVRREDCHVLGRHAGKTTSRQFLAMRSSTSPNCLLLRPVLQDLLRVVIAHRGLVVQHVEVGILEQLGVAFAQELPDRLLHARIVQFALARRLARRPVCRSRSL